MTGTASGEGLPDGGLVIDGRLAREGDALAADLLRLSTPDGGTVVSTRGRVVFGAEPALALRSEWTGLAWPNDLYVDQDDHVYVAEARRGISVFDLDGKLLARWGEKGTAPGQFADMPHGLCVDSHGDLYVAEVVTPNLFQKFERL